MAQTLNSQVDMALGNTPLIQEDPVDVEEVYEALLKVHAAINILVGFFDANSELFVNLAEAQTITGEKTFDADVILADASNIVLDTTTGTKIGTSTAQKLGLWNATPIPQPAAANQAALTNSTGGSRDGVLSAVSGSGADSAINNNFTDLHELVNEIRTAAVASGLIKGSA